MSALKTLDSINSPAMLSGQSTAFEATVNVQIRQDGALAPLKEDIVMGGSNGVMGPFSKMVNFTKPTATAGAIVLETLSAKDGSISERASSAFGSDHEIIVATLGGQTTSTRSAASRDKRHYNSCHDAGTSGQRTAMLGQYGLAKVDGL